MDLEAIVWGYLPIVIAVILIVGSLKTLKQDRYYGNIIFFILIALANSLAIYTLIVMLFGAWPTYTPHILIVFSILLFIIQKVIHRKKAIPPSGRRLSDSDPTTQNIEGRPPDV